MSRARPGRTIRLRRRYQRRALVAIVALSLACMGTIAYGAVSAVTEMHLCVTPAGSAYAFHPYGGVCGVNDQEVAWAVRSVGTATTTSPTTTTAATTTTTRPPTTTTVPTTTTRPTTTTTQPSGGTPGICPSVRAPSSFVGTHLTESQAIGYAYRAGFHSVSQIQIVVGIGKAESALWTQARRWHPDFGCRPHSDVIGVQGPAAAWDSTHYRQVHSDRGWLQWSTHFHGEVSDAQADDPAYAASHMFVVSVNGTDFHEWDTWPNPAQLMEPSAATVCAAVPATGC